MTDKEAMQLALVALEAHADIGIKSDKAITALRQALANEALDRKAENARELGLDYEVIVEKVEDKVGMGSGAWDMVDPKEIVKAVLEQQPAEPVIDESAAKRIATALGWEPKRKWKTLSSSTINSLACRNLWNFEGDITDGGQAFARAIEQRLKDKNNG